MIEFDHVWKRYSRHVDEWALEDISFHIGPGELVFLLGASGVGKSTILKLITLEERPTTGVVRVAGYDSEEMHPSELPYLRRRCGMVFQDFRLIKDLTVAENLAYCLRMTGTLDRVVIARAVARVLRNVGIFGKRDRLPRELSGGEQQRVAIGRALIHQPPIVLADEPTGNLDLETGIEIMDLLRKLRLSGTAVVVASHQEGLAERFATRTVRLRDRRIAEDHFLRPHGTEIY